MVTDARRALSVPATGLVDFSVEAAGGCGDRELARGGGAFSMADLGRLLEGVPLDVVTTADLGRRPPPALAAAAGSAVSPDTDDCFFSVRAGGLLPDDEADALAPADVLAAAAALGVADLGRRAPGDTLRLPLLSGPGLGVSDDRGRLGALNVAPAPAIFFFF